MGPATIGVGKAAIHQVFLVTRNSSTLARRNVLGILEREAAQVTQGTTHLSIIFGQPGLAGILNNRKIVLFSSRPPTRGPKKKAQFYIAAKL